MLHGSQKTEKAQRFEWLTKHFANTKAQGLDDSQKHSTNTQKNKGYIQLHKIRQCCKQLSWRLILVSIAIQCRILF
jgi:hypothetical protein